MNPARENQVELLGTRIDNVTLVEAVEAVVAGPGKVSRQFAFVNADCLNIACEDPDYQRILESCDAVFGDGAGVRYAAQLKGAPMVDNVNGTDLFPLLCEVAQAQKLSIYLLGGREGVAAAAAARARSRYSELKIAGVHHGFAASWDEVIDDINRSGADVLLVAMGAPAQEKWIAQYRHRLDVRAAVGVGGLFDFVARQVNRAPLWVRLLGFEWLVRFLHEPLRLGKRYLLGNPLFLFRIMRSLHRRGGFTCSDTARSDEDFRAAGSKFDLWQDFEILDEVANKYEGTLGTAARVWRTVGRGLRSASRLLRSVLYPALKRTIDVAVATIAFIALSPVFLLTALAILIENPGPVFYSQARVGRHGKTFRMHKFRSMVVDAERIKASLMADNESADGVIFKMKADPRITRVGRLIRRFSIDELPQLFNVLKGDMTLVGPRPPLPSEVKEYTIKDRYRLEVTPGITCIWQVSGRSDIGFDEQVLLDARYIRRQSIGHDLRLILKTIPAVLSGKGAY